MKGRVLTFYLCGVLCGIDVSRAKEMNRNVEYTVVPGAANKIAGLMNLRGQIITLFDLATILGFSRLEKRREMNCVILKARPHDSDQAGFFVDKPGDVIEVTADMCEALPASLGDIESRFIREVVKLEDSILLVLDLDKIFGA
ncbi:chemotaxis protein CheW [Sporomusa sp.]|uniref:chemotaxis protein CheW n=1 Tax=Sporomusa sp. TaxID=2078658 RepID=UPI002C1AADF4|nr:chemotaxis protein CheW [Sporomusa sp.]HWR06261.1 chemotaxis protein CheW [Sporomusa sp.]